jgi:hypothetical protein
MGCGRIFAPFQAFRRNIFVNPAVVRQVKGLTLDRSTVERMRRIMLACSAGLTDLEA